MSHSISPVTRDNPACFGLCCGQRSKCARYHAIEQSGQDGYHVIDMCEEIDGRHTKFINIAHATTESGYQS